MNVEFRVSKEGILSIFSKKQVEREAKNDGGERGQKLPMIGYQDRINPTAFYFKEVRAKRFRPSTFDIQYSIFCGSLFSHPDSHTRGLPGY